MKLFTTILTVLVLNACAAQKKSTTSMQENNKTMQTQIPSGKYQLTLLENKNQFPENSHLTFNDTTKRVSGFVGCNNYNGEYSVEGNNIKFGEIATTRKMCKRFMDIEQRTLKALENANSFSIKNNTIILSNEKNNLIEGKQTESQKSKIEDTANSIIYTASTRGFYTQVTIKDGIISIQKDRSHKAAPETRKCTTAELNKLKTWLQDTNLNKLSTFEGPTQNRFTDAAANASLKITNENGETFETPNFDHGSPNSNIKDFVDTILTMAKME